MNGWMDGWMNGLLDGDDDEDDNDDNDGHDDMCFLRMLFVCSVYTPRTRVDLGTLNYSSRLGQVAVASASSIRPIGQLVMTASAALTSCSMSSIVSLNTFLNSRKYAKKSEKSGAVSRL